MPFVKIQSNVELDEAKRETILKAVSSLTASEPSKPESMVGLFNL